MSPAILRFLNRASNNAAQFEIPLGVCGEMGGRPLDALALLGLGIRSLSITPASVGPIKAMVRSLDLAQAKLEIEAILKEAPEEPRVRLEKWANQHDVDLG